MNAQHPLHYILDFPATARRRLGQGARLFRDAYDIHSEAEVINRSTITVLTDVVTMYPTPR